MLIQRTLAVSLLACASSLLRAQITTPSVGGCSLFPADSVWNARVDNLPVHPKSASYVATLGASLPAHPDFGSPAEDGYPLNLAHGNSIPDAKVTVAWPFTSDPGPYPIPNGAAVSSAPDLHLIVLDVDHCELYEAYEAVQTGSEAWNVTAISKFSLSSDALKPPNWSSSNAAGTPQLSLLIRYDEVAAGHIDHAVSVTGLPTGNTHVWPASHSASSNSVAPPMGTRFRLKASFNTSPFSPDVRVILEALKTFGMILTDNGTSWHLQGVPDPRWDDDTLHELTQIPGSNFEAVDESKLMISSSSGQVVPGLVPTGWVNIVNRESGKCLGMDGGPNKTPEDEASLDGTHQYDCNGGLAQKFQLIPIAGGWAPGSTTVWLSSSAGYWITPAVSGLSLEVPGASSEPGIRIRQHAYTDNSNWVWTPIATSNGYVYIRNLSNGLVMEVEPQNIYTENAPVQQWSYQGGQNQQWKFVPAN